MASKSSRSQSGSTVSIGTAPIRCRKSSSGFTAEELYTYSLPDQETVLVNARVEVTGILAGLPQEPALPEAPPAAPRAERRIYLDDWVTAPVWDFDTLPPAQKIAGPAIVEGTMTTVLLHRDERASVTPLGWLDVAIAAS